MIGSLSIGSPGLGCSLRETLSAGAETGEIGSGDGEEGAPGGHSGQGRGLLLGCPSCTGGEFRLLGSLYQGNQQSVFLYRIFG